jgi:hypothetical protein
VCGRILDKVVGDPHMGQLDSVMPTHMASGWVNPGSTGSTASRSSITKRMAVGPDSGQRWTYECHARCRNPNTGRRSTYTYRMDSLVVAYTSAIRCGAQDIRLPLGSD